MLYCIVLEVIIERIGIVRIVLRSDQNANNHTSVQSKSTNEIIIMNQALWIFPLTRGKER